MHILLPDTDNCPSWISSRERITTENISWSISTKECCWPSWGWTRNLLITSQARIQLSHRGWHDGRIYTLLRYDVTQANLSQMINPVCYFFIFFFIFYLFFIFFFCQSHRWLLFKAENLGVVGCLHFLHLKSLAPTEVRIWDNNCKGKIIGQYCTYRYLKAPSRISPVKRGINLQYHDYNQPYATDPNDLIRIAFFRKHCALYYFNTVLRTNSADDKLMIFLSFLPENKIWYFIQTVS